jgi:hypothetical protein
MFNPSRERVKFRVPKGCWRLRIHTAKASPDDVQAAQDAPELAGARRILLEPKSLVVLSAECNESGLDPLS